MPERFERYELHETLGTGGMGTVVRARDTTTGQFVALKLINGTVDPKAADRFRLEFEALAGLRNPHIVGVNRFGRWEERFFIDMQLVDGKDLAHILAEHGPLPPDQATLIIGQIASALDSAHAQQLLHRDVKPANILVTNTATTGGGALHCYLADFGITKSMRDDAPRLTSTNAVLGTLDYLAPERIRGRKSDQRIDVYALACVLFQCVTGKPPYAGSQEHVMLQHLNGDRPDASAVNPQVPRRLAEVISQGMSKEPEDRPATAGLFAASAAAALTPPVATRAAPPPGHTPVVSDLPPPPPGRKSVIVAAAAVGLLVGALAMGALNSGAGQEAVAQSPTATQTQTVTVTPSATATPAADTPSEAEATPASPDEAPIPDKPVPTGLVLPAAYAGDWQALVTPARSQRDSTPYPIRLTLEQGNAGDVVGSYELPTLCSTSIYRAQLVAADSEVAHIKMSGCYMEFLYLYPNDDGTLRAELQRTGRGPVEEATFSRQ
ncbi:protein kinase [Pseudonocardia sp. NPDC049635]|uniref:serine/threonine-protein kinase n=1 Tax=Pseudonocardia sp. NPDC049635 TaxID=3155506 RepID=UPI0033F38880